MRRLCMDCRVKPGNGGLGGIPKPRGRVRRPRGLATRSRAALGIAGQARGRELAAAYAQRGFAFTLKRNLDQAKNDLDQAIKIAPDYAPVYVNRANLWTVANQPEHAMADAETALRLDPNLPLAFFVRAGAESKLGLYDRAIADYSEVLRLRPNGGATIYQPRGYAYYRKGDYDHAIADYDEVIKLSPNEPGIYLNRGDVWRAKNELPRAADDYGHAIELAPDNPGGWKGRGTIRLMLHDAAGAVSDFDAAIRFNSNDSATSLDRSAALYFQGEYLRAFADNEKAAGTRAQSAAGFCQPRPGYARAWRRCRSARLDQVGFAIGAGLSTRARSVATDRSAPGRRAAKCKAGRRFH